MLLRIASIAFADPITTSAGVATAEWTDQPSTLKGDSVKIEEADPEEIEEFSNESDAPQDYIAIAGAKALSGSFINMTKAQVVALLGGSVTGTAPNESAEIAASKEVLHTAIKLTDKDGKTIVIPNAKGYCKFSAENNGSIKAPFKFRALQAASDWDVDIVW